MTRQLLSGCLSILCAYLLGILTFAIAYAHPTDYIPVASEYFIVPGLMMLYHPVVAGIAIFLLYVLVTMGFRLNLKRARPAIWPFGRET